MGKGGRSSEEQLQSPTELLALPKFQPFQEKDFNAADFTSSVLAGSRTTAQAQSDELKHGARQLEGALSAHVVTHHHELLQHARKLVDAEHSVQDVVGSVGLLQASVKRIRAEIEGPYLQIKVKTRQLSNLHDTVELLRHLIHRLKLVQKLKQQMQAAPSSVDLAKAARLLTDIQGVSQEADLSGLDAAEADEEYLMAAAQSIQDQAQAALIEGMESYSQAKVGSALQVFFNLEMLQQAVEMVARQHLSDLERGLKAALDSRQLSLSSAAAAAAAAGGVPGGARGLSMPTPDAAGGWQEKLWQGLKGVMEQLVTGVVALWHLQRVVAKKRDPLSHVLFLDVLCPPGQPLLTEKFWSDALQVLADALTAAARPAKGAFVREALTASYPKLASLLESSFSRIISETRVKGVLPAVAPEQLPALLATASSFRDAYLAATLGRLQEAVSSAFNSSSRALPSPAEVQKVIGALHEALKAGGSSGQLSGQVAGVVGKAVRMVAERAEYLAAAGPELRQVTLGAAAGGAANPSQVWNITLCSQLQEVHRSLLSLLPRLPSAAAAALQIPLDVLQATALEVVAPILRAAMEVFEAAITSMHKQQWGAEAGAGMMEASPYVNQLANSIAQFRAEYLSKFVPQPSPSTPSCISTLAQRMAARLVTFWLRHACLLRPLSQPGKLQLARDLGELQLLVGQGLFPLEALGPVHKSLRAFRALLFIEDGALPGAACLKELPPSLVLLHLFSRVPAQVAAPHERSGLSPQQYSKWLDQHSGAELIRGVASALEAAQPFLAAQQQQPSDEVEGTGTDRLTAGQQAVLQVMKQLCQTQS